MSTAARVEAIPPPRTPARRAWILRLLANGALPAASVGSAVMNIRATDLAAAGEPWASLSVWFVFGVLTCLVLGALCMLDRRTRTAGAFAVATVIVVNPITATIVVAFLGVL